MEKDLAESSVVVDRIELWNDGMGHEWREALPGLIPPAVRAYVNSIVDSKRYCDVIPIVNEMPIITSAEELQIARHAGQVAITIMEAGRSNYPVQSIKA